MGKERLSHCCQFVCKDNFFILVQKYQQTKRKKDDVFARENNLTILK